MSAQGYQLGSMKQQNRTPTAHALDAQLNRPICQSSPPVGEATEERHLQLALTGSDFGAVAHISCSRSNAMIPCGS